MSVNCWEVGDLMHDIESRKTYRIHAIVDTGIQLNSTRTSGRWDFHIPWDHKWIDDLRFQINPRKVQVGDSLRRKSDANKHYKVLAVRETGIELTQQLDKPHVFEVFLDWNHEMWYDLEDCGKPEQGTDGAGADKTKAEIDAIDLADAYAEIDRLRKLVVAMAERIFAQSDLLSKKAEK